MDAYHDNLAPSTRVSVAKPNASFKRCSCRRAGLPCTDICSDEENPYENVLKDTDNTEDDENMDEETLVYS